MKDERLSLMWGKSLAAGLAAFLFCGAGLRAVAQPMPYAERLKQCQTCHGEDGVSKIENTPSLAGQPEFFILNQLFLMREGVRKVEAMEGLTKDLTDDDLQKFATYFSKLPPKASGEAVDPELVKRGEALSTRMRCGSCHLPTLAGQEQMPRLARQRIDYMFEAMKAYRDNRRSGADTAMTAVIVGASDADLKALAHYASQR